MLLTKSKLYGPTSAFMSVVQQIANSMAYLGSSAMAVVDIDGGETLPMLPGWNE